MCSLFQRSSIIGTILPVGMHILSTVWTGMICGWWIKTTRAAYQPADTQYSEHYDAYGDQPHENHRDPSKGRVTPTAHRLTPALLGTACQGRCASGASVILDPIMPQPLNIPALNSSRRMTSPMITAIDQFVFLIAIDPFLYSYSLYLLAVLINFLIDRQSFSAA